LTRRLSFATKLDKLGWRSDTAEIAFDNVEIPVENLMGEEKGFPYIMQHFARAFNYGDQWSC
jgi:alkylation response protein AidB-like acyl-CoA dehydrogenase